MAFTPITLISPRGIDVEVGSAIEYNNLTNKGYKPKPAPKSAPAKPAADK